MPKKSATRAARLWWSTDRSLTQWDGRPRTRCLVLGLCTRFIVWYFESSVLFVRVPRLHDVEKGTLKHIVNNYRRNPNSTENTHHTDHCFEILRQVGLFSSPCPLDPTNSKLTWYLRPSCAMEIWRSNFQTSHWSQASLSSGLPVLEAHISVGTGIPSEN